MRRSPHGVADRPERSVEKNIGNIGNIYKTYWKSATPNCHLLAMLPILPMLPCSLPARGTISTCGHAIFLLYASFLLQIQYILLKIVLNFRTLNFRHQSSVLQQLKCIQRKSGSSERSELWVYRSFCRLGSAFIAWYTMAEWQLKRFNVKIDVKNDLYD